MSYRDALLADPLFMVLTGRGLTRHESFDACERVSIRCESGQDELAAIECVLGYVPLSERERLTSHDHTPAIRNPAPIPKQPPALCGPSETATPAKEG